MRIAAYGSLLMCLAALSAVAALFGPAEPWGGVDIGATGAAIFMLCLAAAVWLLAARGGELFPEHTSVTERRAWIGLGFLAVILATFVREMLALSGNAVPEHLADLFSHRFIQRYVVLLIAWSVISHLVGRGAGGVAADERDLVMRHRADRAGDWALTLIVIAGIVVLASVPREFLGWWLAPIVLANLLIGLLIAKSLVEHLVLTLSYRASRI